MVSYGFRVLVLYNLWLSDIECFPLSLWWMFTLWSWTLSPLWWSLLLGWLFSPFGRLAPAWLLFFIIDVLDLRRFSSHAHLRFSIFHLLPLLEFRFLPLPLQEFLKFFISLSLRLKCIILLLLINSYWLVLIHSLISCYMALCMISSPSWSASASITFLGPFLVFIWVHKFWWLIQLMLMLLNNCSLRWVVLFLLPIWLFLFWHYIHFLLLFHLLCIYLFHLFFHDPVSFLLAQVININLLLLLASPLHHNLFLSPSIFLF